MRSGALAAPRGASAEAIAAAPSVALRRYPTRVGTFCLGASFFSCLSMTIAGIVLKRDRLMGIGQMITMPLFFASNALYPISVMPGWLKALSLVNPLSYEVDALRGLLIGTHAHLWLDFGVLIGAALIGVATASSLVGRLAR